MTDQESYIEWYQRMLTIRVFEETIEDVFSKGLIKGTAHAAIGQEAVAVGVAEALGKTDFVTSTHRGHGHFLARGGEPRRIMAELFGKVTGYSGGRGGSQLMADFNLGFLGGNGITGGSIPVATGVALACSRKKTGQVVACFFGDGASNQGTFHESLNMAGLWKLPIIYVCENNMYAMSTPVAMAVPIPDIAARAAAYGFEGRVVDGNDVRAVHAAVATARTAALSGAGPALIECKTYRLSGHSRGDPRKYRTQEEEALWRSRDPIARFREVLIGEGVMTDARADEADRAAHETIADAVRFSETSSDPDPGSLMEGVFA